MSASVRSSPDRLVSYVLSGTAVLLPPLGLLAPLGVAPLLTLSAVALLIVAPQRVLEGARTLWPLAALWTALATWAIATSTWSIMPRFSLFEGFRLLAIGVEGLTILGAAMSLSPLEGKLVRRAALLGVLLGVIMAGIELSTNGELTRLIRGYNPTYPLSFSRFDRGMTILVLALWPALPGLGMRRGWHAALAIAVAVIVSMMSSSAAVLALIVGAIVYAFARLIPRAVVVALAAGLVGIVLFLPVVSPSDQSVRMLHQDAPWIKSSGIHRLLIWRFTSDRIADRPLLGWGMGASRDLPGGHRNFNTALPGIGLPPSAEALPLHPHNAVLQWEVELGVPGTALALAIVLWGLSRAGWGISSREGRAFALGWTATAFVIGLLSYGIWQSWWLSSLLLTAALLAGSIADDG
jgi:O-antigen ligase